MNEILQIIGSIASIGAIPLTIYFYLKSRIHKYMKIRREIVNRLSFQIGEGRELNLFEINAVINSKVRENQLKPNVILSNEIVEDLVTETINSPLLESERKRDIINHLHTVHSENKPIRVSISGSLAIPRGSDEDKLDLPPDFNPDKPVFMRHPAESEPQELKKWHLLQPSYFLFLTIGISFLTLAFIWLIGNFTPQELLKIGIKLSPQKILLNLVIGMASSSIASVVVALISFKNNQIRKKQLSKTKSK